MDLIGSVRRLPKAELHLHLDGAVRVATAVELAEDIGLRLLPDEAERRMVGPARCADQAELLTYFDLPIELLQTAPALRRVAAELVESLAAEGVTYAEIRWAPRLHLDRGLGVGEVIEAVAAGVAHARANMTDGPEIALIVTAMRSHPPAANVALAELAVDIGWPLVGFDLAGPEAAYPAPPHAAAFRVAEAGGLGLTAHAGEVPGPERIREALALGVSRIAHGMTTADDPKLMGEVAKRGVTLDLCPTSNVQAGLAPSLADLPIALLHRSGVGITLSTDDPTVSRTTLSRELVKVARAQRLTGREVAEIAVAAFATGFAPADVLRPLTATATQRWNRWARSHPFMS